MKKHLSLIIIVALFLLGAASVLYPTVANYFYEKNSSKAIQHHEKQEKKLSATEIAREKERVRRYNESLVDNGVVLTDPFDPDAFPITEGNYEDLLAFDDILATVEIPAIDVKLPVYHGTSEEVLKKGAGHLENTSLPLGGKNTHTVISAHCGLPAARLFTDLTSVEVGDRFYITVLGKTLAYRVCKIEVVVPEDSSSLMIEEGKDLATLVTCTPYGKNTHRLLVHGERTKYDRKEAQKSRASRVAVPLQSLLMLTVLTIALIFAVLILLAAKRKKR